MKQLIFEYNMKLSFSDYIKEQQFQLRCLPINNLYQEVIDSSFSVYPHDTINKLYDGFNNIVIAGSAVNPHKEFRFSVKGIVNVSYDKLYDEECHPIFKYETSLTKYYDEMKTLIEEDDDFYKMMDKINNNVYYKIKYIKGSSNIKTTAYEAFLNGSGVCQDFSHIMISLCRHLGYPARYVAGMLYGEGATHAWVEVYYDNKWHAYDPTNNKKVDDNYIVLAKGRDYNDCIIDKGIFIGNCNQYMEVSVNVK